MVRRGDTGGAEVVGSACGQSQPLRDGPPVGPIDGEAVVVGAHLSGRGVEEPLRPALRGYSVGSCHTEVPSQAETGVPDRRTR